MLVTIALLDPEARHMIVLNGSDISNAPKMVLPPGRDDYLTALDVRKLAWAVGQVRGVVKTAPLSQLLGDEVSPGEGLTGEDLKVWVVLLPAVAIFLHS